MCRKIIKIVINFYKTAIISELVELFMIPIISVAILLYILPDDAKTVLDFTKTFTDSVISIVSLLAAFGIASITILLTSSSNNINEAKNMITERKEINKKNITYFQLLVLRNFYSLIMQLSFLLIAVAIKILFLKFDYAYKFLYIEVFLFIHILLTQFLTISSIFHLIWKEK